jgi:glycosyltransferase involved in cell wall biosynthesis
VVPIFLVPQFILIALRLYICTLNQPFPIIGVLLCTYNGDKYLEEQLHSIAHQTYKNWHIFASDDGSTDRTIEILKAAQELYGKDRVDIIEGPKQGPTKNFLSLLKLTHTKCEYFAFSDQDDIWYEDKLARAINAIGNLSGTLPALYCSSTDYISEGGEYLQKSYVFKHPPSFENALVQSIAGGNTMVLNRSGADLLTQTPAFEKLIAHDWWAYIVISGGGGVVYYDLLPSLAYRQHSGALVGGNRSFTAKVTRIRKLLDGKFKEWNDENLYVLDSFKWILTPDNQNVFTWFKKTRSNFFFVRMLALIRSGVRRQSFMGNIALCLGVIFNKV